MCEGRKVEKNRMNLGNGRIYWSYRRMFTRVALIF